MFFTRIRTFTSSTFSPNMIYQHFHHNICLSLTWHLNMSMMFTWIKKHPLYEHFHQTWLTAYLTLEHVNGVVRSTTNAVSIFLAPGWLTNVKHMVFGQEDMSQMSSQMSLSPNSIWTQEEGKVFMKPKVSLFHLISKETKACNAVIMIKLKYLIAHS